MTVEEMIARAAYEHNTLDNEVSLDEYPWEKAPEWEKDNWRRLASAVIAALKAAGLVVAPYHGKIERHGDRLTICGITEDEYNQFISGMGAIAIRAATGREG